jgi:hypothetical protein
MALVTGRLKWTEKASLRCCQAHHQATAFHAVISLESILRNAIYVYVEIAPVTTIPSMKSAFNRGSALSLLHLPLEVREEIFSNLLLEGHVYASSSAPRAYSRVSNMNKHIFYVDTRIYLPARFASNMLWVCSQLREECLGYLARRLNSRFRIQCDDMASLENNIGREVEADEAMERLQNNDIARITLEVCRDLCGSMFIPERSVVSPCFLSLVTILGHLRKIEFAIWAGEMVLCKVV